MSKIGSVATPDISAEQAKVSLSASIFANTKASLCFSKIINSSVWQDWNELTPEVVIRSHPPGGEPEAPKHLRNYSISVQERGKLSKPSKAGATQIERIKESEYEGEKARQDSEDVGPLDQPSARSKSVAAQSETETRKSGEGVVWASKSDDEKTKEIGKTRNRSSGSDPNAPYTGRFPSASGPPRVLSVSSIYNELPVRLRLGTAITLLTVLDPSKKKTKKVEVVITELSRPGEGGGEKPVYRITWSSDTSLTFPSSLPKWLRYVQRVTEVRPVIRGDGGEDCEISTWECQKGLLARFMGAERRDYLQRMLEQKVRGLKEYCEAMGGAVDRRDFSIAV